MAASPVPTTLFTSSEFLFLGGSILFRNIPPGTTGPLEVCLIHHPTRDEWLLPKGRKDREEDLSACAVRETYEETGYPCKLLPLMMDTRAPTPGVHAKDHVATIDGCSEPFTLSIRHTGARDVKVTAWFATVCTGEHQEGTQMPTEAYTSQFFTVDEALQKAAFRDDRDIILRAATLVQSTYPDAEATAS
ncbi:NUDIX hydrolase domain-like protein [Vararia minispora EC-137]|uniref:NUDIX hydrolase domain-like protein n=1 Tax=Vararia minispora EC-137 TaxID=1314806 RepID=A0ACB8QYD3_9AGAM|nr:NUDIX hydrolase domain-like protein [Vararia minispora EC-137]